MIWVLLLPLWALFNLIAYPASLVLPYFAEMREGPCDNNNAIRVEPRLPRWLSWFDTFDNSLYGDHGWRTEHRPDDWNTIAGMGAWLRRNPAYGFERSILAAIIKPSDKVTYYGDPSIQDKPKGKTGWCFTRVGSYWNFYAILPTAPGYCFILNFGWKLKTYAENPDRVKTQATAQYVFSPRPSAFRT